MYGATGGAGQGPAIRILDVHAGMVGHDTWIPVSLEIVLSTADISVYNFRYCEVSIILDDSLISGSSEHSINDLIFKLKNIIEGVDLGEAAFLLGLAMKRDMEVGTIQLTQKTYGRDILGKYGMADSRITKKLAKVDPMITTEETFFLQSLRPTLEQWRDPRYTQVNVPDLERCVSASRKKAKMNVKSV